MSGLVAIDRAAALVARGRFRPAVETLKQAIRGDPWNMPLRLALAQIYRDARYPDQAGRWGILEPDWTTYREQELFLRSINPHRAHPKGVAEIIALPPGSELPEFLLGMMATGPTAERTPAPRLLAPDRAKPQWSSAALLARVLFWMGSAIFALGLMLVFGAAFAGADDLRVIARVVGTTTITALVASAIAWAIHFAMRRRWVISVCMLVAALAGIVLVAVLAPSPGAWFPWETPR